MKNKFWFKTYFLFLILTIIIAISCSDDDGDYENIIIPENFEFDVNSDNDNDFELKYLKTNLEELPIEQNIDTLTFDRQVQASIFSKNNNELFYKKEGLAFIFPSLAIGDTVSHIALSDFFWSQGAAGTLMRIKRFKENGEWQIDWNIETENPTNTTVYIVTKVNSNSKEELCWVELELNTSNGEVQVVNKNCVEDDFLIVGK